jgi:hypothetical protein
MHGAHGGTSFGHALAGVERRVAREMGAVPQASLPSGSA